MLYQPTNQPTKCNKKQQLPPQKKVLKKKRKLYNFLIVVALDTHQIKLYSYWLMWVQKDAPLPLINNNNIEKERKKERMNEWMNERIIKVQLL